MRKFNKILVPTDFSKGAELAYPVAQKIAALFGGKIDFIHVIPTVKYLSESSKKISVPLNLEEDIYPKIISETEHQLENAMDRYITDESRGEYFVKIDRKPSLTIAEHALRNQYDIIIMGAHGKHESRLFRGTTTEKVIRGSRVPVFSIDGKMDEHTVNDILVPTDTSRLSFAAIPLAVTLAAVFKSSVTLFHVLELYGSISENIPRKPDSDEAGSLYEFILEELAGYLKDTGMDHIRIRRTGTAFDDRIEVADGTESRSIPLYTRIGKGISAHYEIESYAAEAADMVVMATHGHSGFAHLILGSTAEKVAQYCRKPIVTVRPEMKQAEAG